MATSENMASTANGLGNGRANSAGNLRARNSGTALDEPGHDPQPGSLSETDHDGGVPLADSAPRTQKWSNTDNVYLRLARAQDDVKTIKLDATVEGKTKDGAKFSYKGVSHAQVVTHAKSALLANGIVFYPVQKRDGVQVTGNKTAVFIEGHFVSVDDSDDRIVTGAWGAGTDFNDKDYSKAFTNAVKNCLAKMLGMSTLEDESDEATPHEPEHKPRAVKNAEALSDIAIKTWADAFKSAIDGCKNRAELKKVRADNSHMLTHPGVPAVTKDYFIDKLEALDGALA